RASVGCRNGTGISPTPRPEGTRHASADMPEFLMARGLVLLLRALALLAAIWGLMNVVSASQVAQTATQAAKASAGMIPAQNAGVQAAEQTTTLPLYVGSPTSPAPAIHLPSSEIAAA